MLLVLYLHYGRSIELTMTLSSLKIYVYPYVDEYELALGQNHLFIRIIATIYSLASDVCYTGPLLMYI